MRTTSTIKLLLLAIIGLLSACSDKGFLDKPSPTGQAFELGIVLNNCTKENESIKYLSEILTQNMEGLPQDEPLFDVSTIPSEAFSASFKLLRNLVIINVNAENKAETIKYRSNVWAKDQAVITIDVPNIESLYHFLTLHETKIPSYFILAERQRYQEYCQKTKIKSISDSLLNKFNVDIALPKGFSIFESREEFIWIGKEVNLIQQGLLVYSFKLHNEQSLTLEKLLEKRDSILQIHVPGNHKGSFMTTEYEYLPVSKITEINGEQTMSVVGLWRVSGDLMGGPFHLYAIPDVKNQRVIVMDAFVYYAEKPKKRNYIRQLDAIMNTISINKQSHEHSTTK